MGNITMRFRAGSVMGQSHKRLGINNQDSRCLEQYVINNKTFTIGVVSDGCTGEDKKRSRTDSGSCFLSQYAVSESRLLLCANTPMEFLPEALYPRCVSYVGQLARMTRGGDPREQWEFIERHLLATINGFVTDGETLVFFSAGDGVTILDGKPSIIDQNNKPLYLAFHQVDRAILKEAAALLPSTFDKHTVKIDVGARFAVVTDGIVSVNPSDRTPFVDEADINALWDYHPEAPAGLQWWLNKQSNELSRFSDDCTVITGEVLLKEVT